MVQQAHLQRLLTRGDHDGFVRQLEGLCHHEVQRTAPNGLDYDDLMQEARLAVLKAARTWDPTRGANPLTLAVTYVRRDLWNASQRETAVMRRAHRNAVSLDAPLTADGTATFGSLLPAPGDVPETAEIQARLAAVERKVAALPPREQLVGRALVDDRPLEETARRLGLSRQRVSQIQQTIRAELRAAA